MSTNGVAPDVYGLLKPEEQNSMEEAWQGLSQAEHHETILQS